MCSIYYFCRNRTLYTLYARYLDMIQSIDHALISASLKWLCCGTFQKARRFQKDPLNDGFYKNQLGKVIILRIFYQTFLISCQIQKCAEGALYQCGKGPDTGYWMLAEYGMRAEQYGLLEYRVLSQLRKKSVRCSKHSLQRAEEARCQQRGSAEVVRYAGRKRRWFVGSNYCTFGYLGQCRYRRVVPPPSVALCESNTVCAAVVLQCCLMFVVADAGAHLILSYVLHFLRALHIMLSWILEKFYFKLAK